MPSPLLLFYLLLPRVSPPQSMSARASCASSLGIAARLLPLAQLQDQTIPPHNRGIAFTAADISSLFSTSLVILLLLSINAPRALSSRRSRPS